MEAARLRIGIEGVVEAARLRIGTEATLEGARGVGDGEMTDPWSMEAGLEVMRTSGTDIECLGFVPRKGPSWSAWVSVFPPRVPVPGISSNSLPLSPSEMSGSPPPTCRFINLGFGRSAPFLVGPFFGLGFSLRGAASSSLPSKMMAVIAAVVAVGLGTPSISSSEIMALLLIRFFDARVWRMGGLVDMTGIGLEAFPSFGFPLILVPAEGSRGRP